MSGYRRGAVLGLTVAETFILLTFLLLVALLGLTHRDELSQEPDTAPQPGVWVRPEEIETLVNRAEAARKAQEDAERNRGAAELERDEARRMREAAEQERAVAELERNLAREEADKARKSEAEARQARAAAEQQRDKAERELNVWQTKGKNPPCWYQIVSAGEGKTREKSHHAFDVAIYETGILLAPRPVPTGGAFDDGGGPYAEEWKRLRIEELPYGRRLSDDEFTEAVRNLVAQGRSGQVRTYDCVFSVRVWDMTPDHAKKRWKYAHDRIIEGSFSAYTVRDLEWTGVE